MNQAYLNNLRELVTQPEVKYARKQHRGRQIVGLPPPHEEMSSWSQQANFLPQQVDPGHYSRQQYENDVPKQPYKDWNTRGQWSRVRSASVEEDQSTRPWRSPDRATERRGSPSNDRYQIRRFSWSADPDVKQRMRTENPDYSFTPRNSKHGFLEPPSYEKTTIFINNKPAKYAYQHDVGEIPLAEPGMSFSPRSPGNIIAPMANWRVQYQPVEQYVQGDQWTNRKTFGGAKHREQIGNMEQSHVLNADKSPIKVDRQDALVRKPRSRARQEALAGQEMQVKLEMQARQEMRVKQQATAKKPRVPRPAGGIKRA